MTKIAAGATSLKTALWQRSLTVLATGQLEAQTAPPPAGKQEPAAKVKCGLIGLGARGRDILDQLGRLLQADVAMICDSYPSMLRRGGGGGGGLPIRPEQPPDSGGNRGHAHTPAQRDRPGRAASRQTRLLRSAFGRCHRGCARYCPGRAQMPPAKSFKPASNCARTRSGCFCCPASVRRCWVKSPWRAPNGIKSRNSV